MVEEFNAKTAYQCAISKNGCAAGDLYLDATETTMDGGVTCRLCGLVPAVEDDYSDLTGKPQILKQMERVGLDDSTKQLEAVAIVGIVVGIVGGCMLLACLLMLRSCCCGSRRRKSAQNMEVADDKGSDGTDSQTDRKEEEEDEQVSNPIV